MKAVSVELAAHIAGQVTNLAECWHIQRADGTNYFFTSHQVDIVFGGNTYVSIGGVVNTTAQAASEGVGVDSAELLALLAAAGIQVQDVLAGKFDYCDIFCFLVNWADLTQGRIKLMRAKAGDISAYLATSRAEMRSLTQLLKQRVGRSHTVDCPYNLGDTHCGVNLALWTTTGTLTGVTNQHTLADTARTEANGHFAGGKLTLTSGASAGLAMEVKSWTLSSKTFVLVADIPLALAMGNTYTVYKGCDKGWGTVRGCKSFNNTHFGGFLYIPGAGFLRSYPDAK